MRCCFTSYNSKCMFRWNLRDENYKMHKKIPGDEGYIFKVELSIFIDFIHPFLQMIDGVKLVVDEEVDRTEVDLVKVDNVEVDLAEMKMRKLVDMWGNVKQGDNTKLSVAMACPICPDQVHTRSFFHKVSAVTFPLNLQINNLNHSQFPLLPGRSVNSTRSLPSLVHTIAQGAGKQD